MQISEDHLIVDRVRSFPSSCVYKSQGSPGAYSTAANVHDGQRKLMVSEIEFFTQVHVSRLEARGEAERTAAPPRAALLPRLLCVYAGACPCLYLDHLMEMFPCVSWVLIDPEFGTPRHKDRLTHWDPARVSVYAELCTDDVAVAISDWVHGKHRKHPIHAKLHALRSQTDVHCDDLVFISDIRSNACDEHSIACDMDDQSRWFRLMGASAALLKFRLPFCPPGGGRCEQRYESRVYLDGLLYLPVWGCPSTTECRLYVTKGCASKVYCPRSHERRMAGFESSDRPKHYRVGRHTFTSWDTAAEWLVLRAHRMCMARYGHIVQGICICRMGVSNHIANRVVEQMMSIME